MADIFIYCVSVMGVTGMRSSLAPSVHEYIDKLHSKVSSGPAPSILLSHDAFFRIDRKQLQQQQLSCSEQQQLTPSLALSRRLIFPLSLVLASLPPSKWLNFHVSPKELCVARQL